jgi:cell division septum initiation protein DivIVA
MNVVPILNDPKDTESARAAVDAVQEVSDVIDVLNERLQDATQRINQMKIVRAELELGQLFARAQEFADGTVNRAEERAQSIVLNAHEEAARILTTAKQQANDIEEEAKRSSVPSPEIVRELNQAIDGFMMVNKQLVLELGYLRTMVAPGAAVSAA